MKQVQIRAHGGPEVLQIVEVERPTPGPGELLVKVEAAGVNYSDVLRRRNTYYLPTPVPFVPGTEAAGTVVALGEGVTQFQMGQPVLAAMPHGSGYSEYVTAPAMFCIPLPPHLPFDVATGIFVQGSTAYLILHEIVGKLAGQSILIHAASGGVGSLLVQLAKMEGATVLGATSTAAKMAKVEALGADGCVNYTEPGWTDEVIRLNGGEKVDYVLEMVGGEIFSQSLNALKEGGTVVVYGAASGQHGMIHSEHFVDFNQNLKGFSLGYTIENRPEVWQAALGAVIGLVAEDKLNVVVGHRFPLVDVVNAHTLLESRKTSGKLVLIPGRSEGTGKYADALL